jgi:hypothetical protein
VTTLSLAAYPTALSVMCGLVLEGGRSEEFEDAFTFDETALT